jgi:hypothetical protein
VIVGEDGTSPVPIEVLQQSSACGSALRIEIVDIGGPERGFHRGEVVLDARVAIDRRWPRRQGMEREHGSAQEQRGCAGDTSRHGTSGESRPWSDIDSAKIIQPCGSVDGRRPARDPDSGSRVRP